MYIFQFTLPLTLNLIIMINTTPPLPTFFFYHQKKSRAFAKDTVDTCLLFHLHVAVSPLRECLNPEEE